MSRPTAKERAKPGFVPFNRPTVTGKEQIYLDEVFKHGKFSGGGQFSSRCCSWLKDHLGTEAALTTTSCTHALEMAALLCNLKPGDEVVLPSYAFPTTASAFARCGATLVFVDVEPGTMNIDPAAVEGAVTEKTRVVVALHYAGVACDLDDLTSICQRYDLLLVEDSAQALFSSFAGRACGTFGTFGCVSFHETKNIQCGEGGVLLVNDPDYVDRAEIIWEKGTDRTKFFRGELDKYTWQDVGSSYVLGELNAAFLLAQLEEGHEITSDRLRSWHQYRDGLAPLVEQGLIEVPSVPRDRQHNGHMFWIKTTDEEVRSAMIHHLRKRSIHSVFHYQPLHTSPAGRRFGRYVGENCFTTRESERLLRLPLYYQFARASEVVAAVKAFFLDGEATVARR